MDERWLGRIERGVVYQDVDGVGVEARKGFLDDAWPSASHGKIFLHTGCGNAHASKLGCKRLGCCLALLGDEANGYVCAAGCQLTGNLRTDAS